MQGIGGNTGKAADIEGISGIYPGNAVEQGSGAAEERLRALFFNVTEEQLLTGRVAYHRGGLTGKGKPEEEVFLSNLVQGSGGDTGKGADSAGVPGVYPGDFKEQNTGAAGKEFFMDSGREATIAVKTPPPGEIIPDGGLEGQPQGGGEPFSDEGTLKGSSLVSTLYVEGAPGEGMGNASSSFVPSQSTGCCSKISGYYGADFAAHGLPTTAGRSCVSNCSLNFWRGSDPHAPYAGSAIGGNN